jgi:hypothetical protein
MSVSEYDTRFTPLSCYAPGDVVTDEKKQDCFLNGLNDGLAYVLEACDFENFQGMVNKTLVLENCHGAMERKRKQERQHLASSNSRHQIGSSSAGPMFHPVQQQQQQQRPQIQPRSQLVGQGFLTPQRQFTPRRNNF